MTELSTILQGKAEKLQQMLDQMPDKPESQSGTQSAMPLDGEKTRLAMRDAGFPTRHSRKDYKTLSRPVFGVIEKYWPKIQGGDATLLLYGPPGTGKTQIATEWAKLRIGSGSLPGIYCCIYDMIADIKSTWGDHGRSIGTERDVIQKYKSTRYLVIDELHDHGAGDWEMRTIRRILDYRYHEMLATVMICNGTDETISAEIPQTIIDRINETGGTIHCDWEGFRK